jgi:hypothetical protein
MVEYAVRFHRFHFGHLYRLLLQVDHDVFHHLLGLARRERSGSKTLLVDGVEDLDVDARHFRRPLHLALVTVVRVMLSFRTGIGTGAPPRLAAVLSDV